MLMLQRIGKRERRTRLLLSHMDESTDLAALPPQVRLMLERISKRERVRLRLAEVHKQLAEVRTLGFQPSALVNHPKCYGPAQ